MKIAIAVPLTYNNIPVEFFESYISMKKPIEHIFFHAGGYQGLAHIRNQLVEGAKKYKCSHILFLDVDHRHHPDTITKLLSHNSPIVSGLSYMRQEPFEPCLFRGIINKYDTVTKWVDGELIEVDSVGAACLLINMGVFENIEAPYFNFMPNPVPEIKYSIGEDVYFCNKLKQAGYKIYVDTSCTNKHIGQIEVDGKVSAIWQAGENLIREGK